MKKTLLTLACSMAIFMNLNAATVTWDGGAGTTNWLDAMNWDSDAIPTISDDIVIDGNDVTLSGSTTVLRVFLTGSSSLTVNGSGELNVTGFTGDDEGFEVNNSAMVINNGAINISNILGGVNADGLYVRGTFVNNAMITIDAIAQHGLYVQRGDFTNSSTGTITISGTGQVNSDCDGLYVDDSSGILGLLTNNGSITINTSTGDDGIYVNDQSTFVNNQLVLVDGSGDNGIRLDDGGIFNNMAGSTFNVDGLTDDQILVDNNNAVFNNSGTVNLTNSDNGDAALYVIDNGLFNNLPNGEVNISDSENYGIQIDANQQSAEIVNQGTITVTNPTNDGLRIQEAGLFTNSSSGVLIFTGGNDEAIQIDDNMNVSSFDNFGNVNILDSGDHGMEIFGTFNNEVGGEVNATDCLDDGIRMRNSGVFNNDGAIKIDNSTDDDIETNGLSSFINSSTATFAPGSSPGDLVIRRDFDLGSAVVTFEIDGPTPITEYDVIENKDNANNITISGATAHLVFGYTPEVGDEFTILTGTGGVIGQWLDVTLEGDVTGVSVDYDSNTDEVIIRVEEILPVELTYFDARASEKGTQLRWQTATEINNQGFDIERSINGNQWTSIGSIDGQGDSYRVVDYTYLDEKPLQGINYYRLKQNDFDGNYEYSDVVSVQNRKKLSVDIFPNPVNDILYIDAKEENTLTEVYNLTGELLWSQEGSVGQISFENYENGIYLISITTNAETTVQKIVKQ